MRPVGHVALVENWSGRSPPWTPNGCTLEGMSTTCDECRNPIKGEGHRTVVRVLCDRCYEISAGTAAGLIAGGSVGNSISTAGLFTRVRAERKKK